MNSFFLTVISQLTPQKVAEVAGVSVVTVYSWMKLKSAPGPLEAQKLIDHTNGILNLEEIYRPFITANHIKTEK